MMTRLLEDIRSAPTRIRAVPGRINARRRSAHSWARRRVRTARSHGPERLWTLQADALERFDGLLDRTTEFPVIGRLTAPAADLVQAGLDRFTAAPVDGYDELNVKKASKLLSDLNRLDLVRIRRYEQAHKARKTLIAAIDRELDNRDKDLGVE